MSGIFGIFNRNGKVIDKRIFETMLNAASCWGPDDRGIWTDGPVALGHTMLWNTPESKYEHLPLDNDTYVLTMDARIDNRDELLEQLDLPDKPIDEIGDSEFILAAYKKWGEECPKYLLGDFVFTIWDEKKQQFFCARDHLGIKPFYYYLDENKFIFSNDIRVLIANQKIPKKLNDESVARYIQDSSLYHKKDTFFNSITKLPAATSLTISSNNFIETQYWDVERCPRINYNSFEEYVSKLYEIFINSVEVRLRSNYAITSHLSGGLDSSSIAVFAARKLQLKKKSLYAFNWVRAPYPRENPNDPEWGFSSKIANQENIDHEYIELTPEYIADQYEKLNIILGDNSYWEENLVRKYTKEKKSRTILSGFGGDELISYGGYSYSAINVARGRFFEAFKTIYLRSKSNKKNLKYFFKQCIKTILYPFFNKYMAGIYKVEKNNAGALTKPDFFEYLKGFSPTVLKFKTGLHQEQLGFFNHGYILERLESWSTSGMHDKIEYRYPLLDKRVVEFALGVPEDLFIPTPYPRKLFRSVIKEFLPNDILSEGKYASPKNFYTRKQLWLDALEIWLDRNQDINNIQNKQKYIDVEKLISKIKEMVSQQRLDFENIIDIEAVHPSLMLLSVLKRL